MIQPRRHIALQARDLNCWLILHCIYHIREWSKVWIFVVIPPVEAELQLRMNNALQVNVPWYLGDCTQTCTISISCVGNARYGFSEKLLRWKLSISQKSSSPKCSYLLAIRNKTCTVCSTYVESGICRFSREFFQWKPRYPYNIMTCNLKTNCRNLRGANLSCHIQTAFYSCFRRIVILYHMFSRGQLYQCTFDLRWK